MSEITIIHINTGKSFKVLESVSKIQGMLAYGHEDNHIKFTLSNNKSLIIIKKNIVAFYQH